MCSLTSLAASRRHFRASSSAPSNQSLDIAGEHLSVHNEYVRHLITAQRLRNSEQDTIDGLQYLPTLADEYTAAILSKPSLVEPSFRQSTGVKNLADSTDRLLIGPAP